MKRTSAESRRRFRPGGSDFRPARFPHMRAVCFFLLAGLLAPASVNADWMLKRVASIPSGRSSASGDVLCGDTDHDSLAEVIFANWEGARTWQFWECAPMNQYRLVKSDTFRGGERHGLDKGMFLPNALGDIDDDGLTDILGFNYEDFSPDSYHFCICVYESPDVHSYPDTLVWSYCYSNEGYIPHSWLPGDLDQDGRKEILLPWDSTLIFESRGENQYEPVAGTRRQHLGYDYAFGDFDRDGRNEFVTVEPFQRPYSVIIYRCTGDDQYALADSSIPPSYNGYDLWSGDDLDRDGRPEFFVSYMTNGIPWWEYTLCMYEAVTPDSYARLTIDSIYYNEGSDGRNSACADIDLDGIQEVVWSFNGGVRIFKATGNNQFTRVWNWWTQWMPNQAYVTCYDMNGNGYPDIVISGTDHTWMMEMEAIRVLAPNRPGQLTVGDTYPIRWRLFDPPRCDSVSLFLRRGAAWQLDTIAHGLPPDDTVFDWIVSEAPVDSCHVVAFAYGPGWQYDESDTAFWLVPGGVNESAHPGIVQTELAGAFPNPAAGIASIRFSLEDAGRVNLVVRDADGRVVANPIAGFMQPGQYTVSWSGLDAPPGVYFIDLQAAGYRMTRKLVVTR